MDFVCIYSFIVPKTLYVDWYHTPKRWPSSSPVSYKVLWEQYFSAFYLFMSLHVTETSARGYPQRSAAAHQQGALHLGFAGPSALQAAGRGAAQGWSDLAPSPSLALQGLGHYIICESLLAL